MGVVYRAQHQLIGKAAAVKLLLPELSSNHDIVNRFFTEARAATAVRHPGIVEVFDFGYLQNGMAYIVMELLEGEPLSRRLQVVGKIEERHALIITRGVASALAAAHSKQIVHRDLKPDNIFLVPDDGMQGGERPKILDFGIAKVSEAQRGTGSKTRTGAVMGTPTYMSPEQCRGAGEVDHRSDLYSVGCILYEMVTGRPPFQAEGVGELIAAHMLIEPDAPTKHNPQLSAQTEALIKNLLAKQPSQRIQSAAELARILGQGSMPAPSTGNFMAPTVGMPQLLTPIPTPVPLRTQPLVGQPGVPTTLSGAASENAQPGMGTMPPPSGKSKVPLFAGIGIVLAGGIAAAVVLGGGGGGGNKTPAAGTGSDPATGSAVASDIGTGAASGSVAVETTPDAGVAAVTPDAAEVAAAPIDAGVAVDAAAVATSSSGGKTHHSSGGKTGGKTGGGKTGGTSGSSGGKSGGTDASQGSGSGTGKRVDRGD
jgi:eukaryotic-like serine/threonine-protein kinase